MKTMYEVAPGISFPISGNAKVIDPNGSPTGETIPIVDIPMVSDYKWQSDALESRLKHPEWYENDENVSEVIERLKMWLFEHATERQVA